MNRINWDEIEEILLIDYAVKVSKQEIEKKEAVSTLSSLLRRKATEQGKNIDDTFRNESGISMKIENIRYLITDGKQGLSAFSIADEQYYYMYKYNNDLFNKVLSLAKCVTDNENDRNFFLELIEKYGVFDAAGMIAAFNIGKQCAVKECKLCENDNDIAKWIVDNYQKNESLTFLGDEAINVYHFADFLIRHRKNVRAD